MLVFFIGGARTDGRLSFANQLSQSLDKNGSEWRAKMVARLLLRWSASIDFLHKPSPEYGGDVSPDQRATRCTRSSERVGAGRGRSDGMKRRMKYLSQSEPLNWRRRSKRFAHFLNQVVDWNPDQHRDAYACD